MYDRGDDVQDVEDRTRGHAMLLDMGFYHPPRARRHNKGQHDDIPSGLSLVGGIKNKRQKNRQKNSNVAC